MTLTRTNVRANSADLGGGGIFLDSTVTKNSVVSGQGGSWGGGIYTFSGAVPLNDDSKVGGNTPDDCDPDGAVPGCTG